MIVLAPIIVVSAALLAVSGYTTNRIESELGTALVHATGQRVEDHLASVIADSERMSDLYTHRVVNGTLPPEPDVNWQKLMYESILIRPSVGSMTYATPRGQAIYVMRIGESFVVGRADGPDENQTVEQRLSHSGGIQSGPPLRRYKYVVTERPWFAEAMKYDRPIWTDIYFWFSDAPAAMYGSRVAGISYVRQIHNANGEFLGVLSVDLKLESLSSILRGTEVSRFGSVMVLDRHHHILADSILPAGMMDGTLKTLQQIGEPDAIATAKALERSPLANPTIATNIDGRLVYSRILQPSPSLRWQLITVLPESNLTGTYVPRQRRAVLENVLIVAVAALLGWYLSRRLSRPIAQLANHMKQIGEGRFEQKIDLRTTTEFEQLSNAVNEMTRRVQEQVRLQAEKEAIQRSAEAKTAFFNRVTHDLRTPLNAIIGYTEMLEELQRIRRDKTVHEDLQRIMQASRQLLHLINDLLDLAKAEAGGMQLRIAEIELAPLLAEVESVSRPLSAKNGNVLVFQVDEDCRRLRTDPQRLKQILLNLISNAAKFTHNGQIDVRVRCDSAHISFQVKDTGMGIPRDKMERIFEPFAQASMTDEGTGLGLAISRQLTELLGGEIEVASEVGQGTVVQVLLPRAALLPATPDDAPKTASANTAIPL